MPTNNTPDMTVEEGNKLIELFYSGRKLSDDGTFFGRKQGAPKRYENWYDVVAVSDLQYHSSWDWLMPVAEKIVKMTPIKGIVIQFTNMKELVVDALMRADKEKIWASCVHFTQWYNTQTSKQ